MEKDLRAFFQALLDVVPDAVTAVDSLGNVIHWNTAASELYGISAQEIVGRPLRDFFNEDNLIVLNVLKSGQPIYRLYHRPRGDRHVQINAQPIYESGKIIGAMCSEQDITRLVNLHDDLAIANFNLQQLEKVVKTKSSHRSFELLKGKSTIIQTKIQLAQKVSVTDATVLLTGESGVGKELFARAIHDASPRSEKPFVALNCGAIPAALFESELFGYEYGAFTGAERKGNPGKLTLAQNGTLFLDEIGDLPLELQVKLLRVIQEQSYYRLGSSIQLTLKSRIIAATNRSLEKMVDEGTFRRDLYFRLNVVSLDIPPLRQRPEDIPNLVDFFTQQFAVQYSKLVPKLSGDALNTLMEYPWPGNIRELRNVIERVVIFNEGGMIFPHDLCLTFPLPAFVSDSQLTVLPSSTPLLPQNQKDKTDLLRAVSQSKGNKSEAAKLLGISRATFYNRLQRFFPNGI